MKKVVLLLIMGLLYLPSLTFAQTKNIDCSKDPSVPQGFTLISSQDDGTYQLGTDIKVFSFEKTPITGEKMLAKLGKTVLNACVLDYLWDHKELIPESWKTKHIVFLGSTFADANGNQFFQTLYWWDNRWDTERTYLTESYDDRIAAIK
jgi:hypothetical protein